MTDEQIIPATDRPVRWANDVDARLETLERNAGLDEDYDLTEMAREQESIARRLGEVDDVLAKHLMTQDHPLTVEQRQRTHALGVARDVLATKQFVGSNITGRDISDLITLADWIVGGSDLYTAGDRADGESGRDD